jgi:KDO2-lipid IV(A) lauroyltransferase
MNVIALGHGKRRATDIFRKMREARGIRVIPLGMGIRKCFQVLRNNEMLAMLGDWDIGEQGIKAEFFGRQTLVPKGAASFSLKTGACIVPSFMFRKNEKYHLVFEKPILPPSTGNEEKDILYLTKEFLKVLERYIKEYPGEWFLFHPMWPSA